MLENLLRVFPLRHCCQFLGRTPRARSMADDSCTVQFAFEWFLDYLERQKSHESDHEVDHQPLRSRSRSRSRGSRVSDEQSDEKVVDLASPEDMRLGIISLMRLFKGQQLSEEEAISEAKKVIGVPTGGPSVASQQSESLPGPDPSFKHAMAFSPDEADLARKAVQELRSALKLLDTSTGSRTVLISFRKAFSPQEVAERVEVWKGLVGPKIPVEPLVVSRGGKWHKPVGPQSYATAGGDSRKFVLRLQIAVASKVKKLSLQVKVASKELTLSWM